VGEVRAALEAFELAHTGEVAWVPVGRDNNRGTIEASADPGRAIIERLTNGIDAVLEDAHDRHAGRPECRSPKEAATTWLGVPENGLSGMHSTQRQRLAQRVQIKLEEGEGKDSRVVTVRDHGSGIQPERQADTILSLGEGNKITKHYLAGAYGQGGSATFAVSKFTVVASRFDEQASVGFTVVKYLNLPAASYKIGHYAYLTVNGAVPSIEISLADFVGGTMVRHYGYDLSHYANPFGTNSVYGLLQRTLFDPVVPVWLDTRVHGYRRTIKGSRNALNGAVDEGDDDARGPDLSYNVPLFYVNLGEHGRIGLEYWVLEVGKKTKTPNAAFVEPSRPIVLTLNGQSHAEFSSLLLRRHAELPYLRSRIIVHVDCNGLAPDAKRTLFVSNREEARRGALYDLVQSEVIRALKSDDELARLNAEARDKGLHEEDESAVKQLRSEVARLLRLQGLPVTEGAAQAVGGDGHKEDRPKQGRRRGLRPPAPPIEVQEPPTYIKLLWDKDDPITLFKEQRRYIRVETDANSSYHTPEKPENSRTNIIVTIDGVKVAGSTPLKGGRMRIILEAAAEPPVGAEGTLRVELTRPGLPTLSDERHMKIVEAPKAEPRSSQLTLPPFEVRRVDGPDDPRWDALEWPDDVTQVASSSEMEGGTLIIWYSTVYPAYTKQVAKFEQHDAALAKSFIERYKTWLAVHALLKLQDDRNVEQVGSKGESDEELAELRDRREYARVATLSALFAARDVREAKEFAAADSAE
jgi:hypothetical protein